MNDYFLLKTSNRRKQSCPSRATDATTAAAAAVTAVSNRAPSSRSDCDSAADAPEDVKNSSNSHVEATQPDHVTVTPDHYPSHDFSGSSPWCNLISVVKSGSGKVSTKNNHNTLLIFLYEIHDTHH